MFFYFGRLFTATASGTITRSVQCEKCDKAYFYYLTRIGTGQASSPYCLLNSWAERRSDQLAQKHLQKRLKHEADTVPCPQCGWIQSDMVYHLRRGRHRWLLWTGTLIMTIAGAIGLIIAAVMIGSPTGDLATSALRISLLVVLIGASMLVIRLLMQRAYDPNRFYPQWPEVPPGTPTALLSLEQPGEIVSLPLLPADKVEFITQNQTPTRTDRS